MKFRASAISKPKPILYEFATRATIPARPMIDKQPPLDVSHETLTPEEMRIAIDARRPGSTLRQMETLREICDDVLAAQETERLLRAWLIEPRTAFELLRRIGNDFLERLAEIDAPIVSALGFDDGVRVFYWIKTERDHKRQIRAFGTYDIDTGKAISVRDRLERRQ